MIPPELTALLPWIQTLGGGVAAPVLLTYLILKIRRSNEIIGDLGESLKTHTKDNDKVFKKNDKKFIGLTTFMIRNNGNLSKSDKKELSNLLQI